MEMGVEVEEGVIMVEGMVFGVDNDDGESCEPEALPGERARADGMEALDASKSVGMWNTPVGEMGGERAQSVVTRKRLLGGRASEGAGGAKRAGADMARVASGGRAGD